MLFNGKGKCNLCHPSEGDNALFTDFTFDNLGVPKNPDNPFYPKDGNTCDKCSGELIQRDDDFPEAIQKRLNIYHKETAPLLEFYEGKNLLIRVDASIGDIKAIAQDAINQIG